MQSHTGLVLPAAILAGLSGNEAQGLALCPAEVSRSRDPLALCSLAWPEWLVAFLADARFSSLRFVALSVPSLFPNCLRSQHGQPELPQIRTAAWLGFHWPALQHALQLQCSNSPDLAASDAAANLRR